ncbi:hypothetical protein LOK49_LG10G00629, partial [Camellia lanceoleosa]
MGIQSGPNHNLPKSFSVSFRSESKPPCLVLPDELFVNIAKSIGAEVYSSFIATLTAALRFQVPKKRIAGRKDRNSILNWMATVGGNVESAAVPTSVLVRVAHELLQARHRYLDEFSAGHAVGAINVPYMFKVGSAITKTLAFDKYLTHVNQHTTQPNSGCLSGPHGLGAATINIICIYV